MICVEEERQHADSSKKVSLPTVDFGFSVLKVIGSRTALARKKPKTSITENNQNITITTSTTVTPSLLQPMTDGPSFLKLSTCQSIMLLRIAYS